MTKKPLILTVCALFLLLCSCGLFQETGDDKVDEMASDKYRAKRSYAIYMDLDSSPSAAFFYTDDKNKPLVFVETKEEAAGHSDDTIVCWPSENTERILFNLNDEVDDMSIDLEPYALEYPVTVHDTVYKWEGVAGLMESFDVITREIIMSPFRAGW
jgi:hypothetical protein